ncbi:MAG: alpha/beta hydrolase [Actinomycetota bacterium]
MRTFSDPDWGATRTIEVSDGARLLVRTAGGADRPTLLCLARHGGSSREFARTAERHTGSWQVVGIDLRGTGGSSHQPPDRGYSQQQWVDDIVEVLDALEVDRVVGIGVSLGSWLLSQLHARRPGAVAAAVAVDLGPEAPPPTDPPLAARRFATMRTELAAVHADPDAVVAAWKRINGHQWPDVDDAEWRHLADATTVPTSGGLRFDLDVDGSTIRAPAQPPPDQWPLWRAFAAEVPVLLVHGALSEVLSADIVERMIAGTAVDVITVPGIGHPPIIDLDPPRGAIDAFLERHRS